MRNRRIMPLLVISLLLISNASFADVVAYNFTGEISIVDGDLEPYFSIGDTITGSFNYNSNSSDANPDPARGNYSGISCNFTVRDLSASTSEFIISINISNPPSDGLLLGAFPPFTPLLFEDFSIYEFVMRFYDSTGTSFNDDSLPSTLPSPSKFDNKNFTLTFYKPGLIMEYDIYGQIKSLDPVPEPATMLLLGSGLLALAGYGRKKFFKK